MVSKRKFFSIVAGESEEESASDAAAEETHKEEGETSDECTE